jgi:hypothetical protein
MVKRIDASCLIMLQKEGVQECSEAVKPRKRAQKDQAEENPGGNKKQHPLDFCMDSHVKTSGFYHSYRHRITIIMLL